MGGSSGGIPTENIDRLEQVAKKELSDAAKDANKHVFISFAHEDEAEINMLRGQAKNDNSDLNFDDYSVKEAFDSKNADYIKSEIREKIERASVTLVYLTEESASSKWVNWEIEESIKQGKGVVGVYKGSTPPVDLPAAFKTHGFKVLKWAQKNLSQAIKEASRSRNN